MYVIRKVAEATKDKSVSGSDPHQSEIGRVEWRVEGWEWGHVNDSLCKVQEGEEEREQGTGRIGNRTGQQQQENSPVVQGMFVLLNLEPIFTH